MSGKRPPMSILQQAEFIAELARRCRMADGSVAKESYLFLDAGEAADLQTLADRLFRMAPHESEIRRVVTGR